MQAIFCLICPQDDIFDYFASSIAVVTRMSLVLVRGKGVLSLTIRIFRTTEVRMTSITANITVHAVRSPDRAALVCDGRSLSWRELDEAVEELAACIASRTPSGAGVALHLPNGLALALSFFAVARAGREAQVLDPAWPPEMLDGVLAVLAPQMIVTSTRRLAGREGVVVPNGSVASAGELVAVLCGHGQQRGGDLPHSPQPEPHLPFYVGFTSGSTGLPKGYRRNHRSWCESFRADAREFGIGGDDVVFAPGALTHSLFLYALASGIHAGATVVLASRFRPASIPALIEGHRASVLYGVPTQLQLILQSAKAAGASPMLGVRWVLSSGAKWFAGSGPELRRLFPRARFAEFYGASELSFVTVAKDGEPVPEGSVGRAFAGVKLTIRDRRGRTLPSERKGRIFVESPFVFSGYATGGEDGIHRAGQALSVGDIGYLDTRGFLHLTGREQRMIVTCGKNVYPEEIERVLEQHGAVAAAAVFGLPDAKRGERLTVALALRPGVALTRAEVITHARRALPLYKVPRAYFVMPCWPRTASGKSDFEALRALIRAGTCEPLT